MLASLLVGAMLLALPATTRTPLLASYERLKYGMFIHYGMSTFTGIEIPTETVPPGVYQADKADPDQWIRVAKDAGMKYAVLTTKHCYGHCLWPTATTDYRVPPDMDVVKGFVAACRRYGVKPGFYYLLGWDARHQPQMDPIKYEAFYRSQVTELLTNYGPIVELWFDIPWDLGPDTQGALQRMYALVKKLQPECLVMFSQSCNVMAGIADPFALTDATYFYKATGEKTRPWPSDITNGERTPPKRRHNPRMVVEGKTYHIPMEVCDTLSPHWFWIDGDWPRPLRSLQWMVANSVGRRANLLLDVPPDKTGRIPESFVRRLMDLTAIWGKKPSDVAFRCRAKASDVWQSDPNFGPDKALDHDPGSRWATNVGVKSAWFEVDLGRNRTISHGYLAEEYGRVRSWSLQSPFKDGWQELASGNTIGEGNEFSFAPTKTRVLRLVIDDAADGPTISSFEVW